MFKKSEKANENYLAKIVKLPAPVPHSNKEVTRLQCFVIDNRNIISGMSAKEGDLYVYFPIESAINLEFLAWSNSFRQSENLNADASVKNGFFDKNGRVKAIRLRGDKSEGYIIPVTDLLVWLDKKKGHRLAIDSSYAGLEFDSFDDIVICEKYVNKEVLKQKAIGEAKAKKNQGKVARVSKIVDGQFRFHGNTSHLSKNMHSISPDDLISITNKLHGSSFVVSKVICKKPLKWHEKVLKSLGVNIVDKHYDLVYSSRKVIKNEYAEMQSQHYYGTDLWGEVSKKISEHLTEGITFYGEVVGFVSPTTYIQDEFDYGCKPGEFDIYIYRITQTNASGVVFEFSWKQVKDYCAKIGLKSVPEYYYGFARDLFDISTESHWQENFYKKLTETYLEKDCDMCVLNSVPAEGIVLRKETSDFEAYKHKSFRFAEHEGKILDKGIVDIETQESEASNAE